MATLVKIDNLWLNLDQVTEIYEHDGSFNVFFGTVYTTQTSRGDYGTDHQTEQLKIEVTGERAAALRAWLHANAPAQRPEGGSGGDGSGSIQTGEL